MTEYKFTRLLLAGCFGSIVMAMAVWTLIYSRVSSLHPLWMQIFIDLPIITFGVYVLLGAVGDANRVLKEYEGARH